jgi:hypothetical protein
MTLAKATPIQVTASGDLSFYEGDADNKVFNIEKKLG